MNHDFTKRTQILSVTKSINRIERLKTPQIQVIKLDLSIKFNTVASTCTGLILIRIKDVITNEIYE